MEVLVDLRARAKDALRRHYGLEPDVTLLRGKGMDEGVTGVFREVVNYIDGNVYVAVRLTDPPELAGKSRKFYHGWEKVDTTQG